MLEQPNSALFRSDHTSTVPTNVKSTVSVESDTSQSFQPLINDSVVTVYDYAPDDEPVERSYFELPSLYPPGEIVGILLMALVRQLFNSNMEKRRRIFENGDVPPSAF